jgi:ubiquinone/menaquinone biosynthesis C-methylase UbiE
VSIYADNVFPWIMDKVMRSRRFSRERSLALRGAAGDVLEIGFGTGLNLPHYPDGVSSVTAIEPSKGMLQRARSRADNSHVPVLLVRENAEELPFEARRFDAVVSTWTLCTVPDARRALSEARRVLKPDGRLFFLEHGEAPNPRDRRIQNLMNPINTRISCGCNLNRDIKGLIEEAGFRIVELHRYLMPDTPTLMAFAAHLFRGEASPLP